MTQELNILFRLNTRITAIDIHGISKEIIFCEEVPELDVSNYVTFIIDKTDFARQNVERTRVVCALVRNEEKKLVLEKYGSSNYFVKLLVKNAAAMREDVFPNHSDKFSDMLIVLREELDSLYEVSIIV